MKPSPAPARVWLGLLAGLVLAVASCDSRPPPPPSCRSYDYDIAAEVASPLGCVAPSAPMAAIAHDINGLWGSAATYCACDERTLMEACRGNAFVRTDAYGYVYFDAALLQQLVAMNRGRASAAAWVLAHEMGHNIQLRFDRPYERSMDRELSADCYAGYFIQAIQCEDGLKRGEIEAVLATACASGDSLPAFDPHAHGSCDQRMSAVQRGMDGYEAQRDPLAVCR